uniref:Amidohydrolase n=1 Tax=Thermofilum pendens TaxID=2269 RepID=A0A7C3WSJ9_THEPE
MGVIEVGELLDHGTLRRNVRIEYEGGEDLYFESAVSPGFSDAHAHPQVVDVGEGGRWANSYEWLSSRRLRVDEGAIRRDTELSAALAEVALLLSLLDGVTLVSMTGSLHGNLRAISRLKQLPRVVLLPTVMESAGWSRPESVYAAYAANPAMWDGYFGIGYFAHSLRRTPPEFLRASHRIALRLNLPFAMHLSEGVDEAEDLVRVLGGEVSNVIAVHCISSPGKCREYGFRVIHCPTSNLYLYGYTLGSLSFFDALGSDWPLVTGTLRRAYTDAVRIHGPSLELLTKATAGGYRVMGVKGRGDAVFFDEPLEKVARGEAEPKLVLVGGRVLVREGLMEGLSLSRQDLLKMKEERVRLAFEKYPLA